MRKRHTPKAKFPYHTWRILPCEDADDVEEVSAKVAVHIDTLRDVYGLAAVFCDSEVRDGVRWGKFVIEGRAE